MVTQSAITVRRGMTNGQSRWNIGSAVNISSRWTGM